MMWVCFSVYRTGKTSRKNDGQMYEEILDLKKKKKKPATVYKDGED